MPNTSVVTITASATGPTAFAGIPATNFNNNNSPAQTSEQVLGSGATVITIPTGTVMVTVQLPANNSVATSLRGATADAGIPMNPAGGFAAFTPASTDTTFVLDTTAAHNAPTTIGLW